jgi:glutathione peroxidase
MLKMYMRRGPRLADPTDVYAHTVTLLDGNPLDLNTFHGRPALIVNTASKCGFTPQYAGLQALHERYGGRGLQVLGTPSPDFAGQEFDQAEQIDEFCQRNYGITFLLTRPLSVRADPDPLWEDIARQPHSGPPAWNFSKYLIDGDGHVISSWSARVAPEDPRILEAIEQALSGATAGAHDSSG